MFRLLCFLIPFLSVSAVLPAEAATTKPIRMSIQLPENDAGGKWARTVFTEAFRRLKVPLEIVTLPESRSYSEVISGGIDGELTRAAQYAQSHPDLVHIQIPSVHINTMAFSSVPIEGMKDLRNPKLRIDYKIGNAVAQAALKGLEPSERISTLGEDLQGFKKLASGRTEVYIGYDASTTAILKTHPALAHKIKYTKVLAVFDVYTFFNPKHKDLALKLEKVLQKMADDGEIEKARLEGEEQAEIQARQQIQKENDEE